jgi:thiol:disulfide interchange protein
MALPYVMLSASKTFRALLPKPGRWMEDFKYLMGFFLLGVAVYLMIGLPSAMAIATVAMCLFSVFSLAIFRRFGRSDEKGWRRYITGAIAAGVFAAGLVVSYGSVYRQTSFNEAQNRAEAESLWKDFSQRALTEAHMKGQHVIVDFTASWCMNCQYNAIAVLRSDEVAALIKRKNILALEADMTAPNPVIESLLHHLGSQSVPFLAVFPGDDPFRPIIMRDLLNKSELVSVLNKLPNK